MYRIACLETPQAVFTLGGYSVEFGIHSDLAVGTS